MTTQIVKRKIRGFFKPDDLNVVRQAVITCHDVMSKASILVRQYYIRWFENKIGEGQSVRDIENESLQVDLFLFNIAISVVQGKTYKTRVSEKAEQAKKDEARQKEETAKDLNDIYKDLFGQTNEKVKKKNEKEQSLSLSNILKYSVTNLVTAYHNNIIMHYEKYAKKLIRCDLIRHGYSLDKAKKYAYFINAHYFYDKDINATRFEEDKDDKTEILSLLPHYEKWYPLKRITEGEPKMRAYEIEVYPMVYLLYMVLMNRHIETEFTMVEEKYRTLYNPLPFHHSFIPCHIRIDTAGLIDLFMDAEKTKIFKTFYLHRHDHEPNVTHKASLQNSMDKVFPGRSMTSSEEHQYSTEIWNFVTNLETSKHKDAIYYTQKNPHNEERPETKFKFDNTIVTDGFSISFQIIDEESACRGRFKKTAARKKSDKEKKEAERKKKADKNAFDDHEHHDGCSCEKCKKPEKVLSNDPGKIDICAICDGLKTVTYTRVQRNKDTKLHTRRKVKDQKRKDNNLDIFESEILSKCSSKSCFSEIFKTYCQTKYLKEDESKRCYGHDFFRQAKFLVYCQTQSSEDRFFQKIKKEFTPSYKNERKYKLKEKSLIINNQMTKTMEKNAEKRVRNTKNIRIAYGNGGRGMNNLKGTPSAPNIRIMNRMAKHFDIVFQDEHFTSKTCPCCGMRTLECVSMKKEGESYKVHHLLRCTNGDCRSRWWNRNVAGSFNILKKHLEGNLL